MYNSLIYYKKGDDMKRLLLIYVGALLMLVCAGCAKDSAQTDVAVETAVYEKYDDLIAALENEDFSSAVEIVEALRLQHYTQEVTEGSVQEVQITAENWNQYFQLQEITQWLEDDLGNPVGFVTHVCLVLQEEYAEFVVAEHTQVEFSWQAVCSVKNCAVDLDNRIVSLENEFKSQTTTFGETETMSGTLSYAGTPIEKHWAKEAHLAAEIGEILIIGEYNLKGELKPVCYDYDDTEITSAQGLLVLRQ